MLYRDSEIHRLRDAAMQHVRTFGLDEKKAIEEKENSDPLTLR